MASSQIFFVSTFFFFFPNTASDKICETSYCDENRLPLVEFPFQLNTSQAKRCGYPGFNLSCDNKNQTTLTLPNSGDFHVDYINYQDNLIYITDPDDCFPRRFLKKSFSLLGSPFQLKNTMSNHNYTFYNCSFNKTTHSLSQPIPCLSSDNFTVFKSYYPDKWLQSRCPVILHAPFSVQLSWNNLNCSLCESGEQCALKSDTSLEVGCFDYSSTLSTRTGLSRRVKYGTIIGVGILGLLCIIWLTFNVSGRASVEIHIRHPNTQVSTLIAPRQATLVAGLDGPTIESYPKFVLGESRRLPKANDNTCSICLSEYQPKETLRTIPKCNHYFHANCIDEWLKKKVTCPICRIQPINPL